MLTSKTAVAHACVAALCVDALAFDAWGRGAFVDVRAAVRTGPTGWAGAVGEAVHQVAGAAVFAGVRTARRTAELAAVT